ncbi:MAG: sugar phosphate isomerase/epimerase [Kiritimatiellae bacterium]|nr:sugar phosphate isomerase/epimerase [Kiritimatiellia bacterium]
MNKTCLAAVVAAIAFQATAEVPFKLGIAGYTFNDVGLDKGLATMKAIDCHYLCHKEKFLSYDATEEEIKAYYQKLKQANVECLSTGPLYACDEASLVKQFEFAKRAGLKLVIGVPYEVEPGKKDGWGAQRRESDKVLDIIEKLVKKYDIYYAIHNHGPDLPTLYPTGDSILKRIEKRDPRIGICFDVGHERRAGKDPIEFIRNHIDRIFDIHLKNIMIHRVKNIAKEGPRGQLDIPGILTALAEVGYKGVCHIEYEKDFKNNAMGLAESVGYYRGVMDSIKVKK